MKMSAKPVPPGPSPFNFGSAAIHIRSSPRAWGPMAFGTPKVVPPSSDLLTVMFGRVRLEKARSLSVDDTAVSCGPIAQSQSPPPAPWSGRPMNFEVEPSWDTRKDGQPPPTPVGPVTKERPKRSVRILGSAAPLLPFSSRFLLKLAAGGAAAAAGAAGTEMAIAVASAVIADKAVARRKTTRIFPSLLELNAAAEQRAAD